MKYQKMCIRKATFVILPSRLRPCRQDGGVVAYICRPNLSRRLEADVAKQLKASLFPVSGVRTRRAYFDCRFGQLHVRTAFPTTGGFDEGVTLFCLHSDTNTSRIFSSFLPEIAD